MTTHPDRPAPLFDRRRAIIAALTGGALAASVGRAVAADDTTTTTASPRREAGDVAVLNGALALERDMVALYLAVYTGATLSADESAIVLTVHDHHKAYVDALVGYMGPEAAPDRAASASAPAGNFAAIAAQLATAEQRAVTSHLASIAAVRGVEAAALLASIVSVEARHQSAMAILAGQPASSVTA